MQVEMLRGPMLQGRYSENRVATLLILIIFFCIILSLAAYILFGHNMISAMYDGKSSGFLNSIVEKPIRHPVEYYIEKGDELFAVYIIPLVISSVFFVFFRLFLRLNLPDLLIALPITMFSSASIIYRTLLSPAFMLNSRRLGWVFSIAYGYKLYYGPHSGPVLPTIYGPMAALVYLPATLVNNPVYAVILGSCISACFYFIPMFWLHARNNLSDPKRSLFALLAFACFCLSTFNSKTLSYSAFAIHADAPALGLCAAACAILYFRKQRENITPLFLSAIFSVLTVFTKQLFAPILLALPFYVLLADGYGCSKRYLLCISLSLFFISIPFLIFLNAKDMIFNMFINPIHHPWRFPDKTYALCAASKLLIDRSILLIAVLIFYYFFRSLSVSGATDKKKLWLGSSPWVMLAIVGFFMIPTSLLGRVKVGSGVNTLSPAVYFLSGAVTLVFIEFLSDLSSCHSRLTQMVTKTVLIAFILLKLSSQAYFYPISD